MHCASHNLSTKTSRFSLLTFKVLSEKASDYLFYEHYIQGVWGASLVAHRVGLEPSVLK